MFEWWWCGVQSTWDADETCHEGYYEGCEGRKYQYRITSSLLKMSWKSSRSLSWAPRSMRREVWSVSSLETKVKPAIILGF